VSAQLQVVLGPELQKYAERLRRPSHRPGAKIIHDPVWRTIRLEPCEVILVDSPLLQRLRRIRQLGLASYVRIPAKPITDSELMAITIPSDADRRRSEATLGCSYHAEVIGIRQSLRG